MFDSLIIFWINRLAGWLVGVKFFAAVVDSVEKVAGEVDLDGDGKKSAVLNELKSLGFLFSRRIGNRAIELALSLLERKGLKV